jgi:hypothetical protein
MASTSVSHSELASAVTCSSCGRTYSLAEAGSLGSTAVERSARAADFAKEHGIDLASAYSVLLGIVSIEAAMSMSGGLHVAVDQRAITYDPGFRNAIENGTLTLQQAVERGDRVAYASRLAQRHGLDMNLAFMLADNQIALAEALQRKTSPELGADTAPDPGVTNVRRRPLAAALTLALAALCGWAYWSGSWDRGRDGRPQSASTRTEASSATPYPRAAIETQARSGAPASSSVELVENEKGVLTQVTGPDPKSVLEAFCSHPRNRAKLSPRSFAPSAVRSSGDQIGLVEDHEHGSALKAVVISRDPRSRRWQIGNGKIAIGFLDSIPVSVPAISVDAH